MAEQLGDAITANCRDINKSAPQKQSQVYYYPDVEDRPVACKCIYSKHSVSMTSESGKDSFRLHIHFNKHDNLETAICSLYTSFIQKRADFLKIFRRRPVRVDDSLADLSLLITKRTVEEYDEEAIGRFIMSFAQEFEKERTAMKMYINSKARSVATQLLGDIK